MSSDSGWLEATSNAPSYKVYAGSPLLSHSTPPSTSSLKWHCRSDQNTKEMPRPRVKRQLCDCLTCLEPKELPAPPQLALALARQEPPPKSLIIIVNGVLCTAEGQLEITSLDVTPIPHLDTVAREGCCGMLACVAEEQENEEECLEAQILRPASDAPHSLTERFKDMHAILLSNTPEYEDLGRIAGCQSIIQLPRNSSPKELLPNIDDAVHQIITALRILPLEEFVAAAAAGAQPISPATVDEEEDSDMAILMLPIDDASKGLVWLDSLVRALDAVPGFKDVCLLSLVLGAGRHVQNSLPVTLPQQPVPLHSIEIPPESPPENNLNTSDRSVAVPALHRPLQSYQFRGPKKVKVDTARPAIVVHRLAGIVRRDRVETLSFSEISRRGGGGCILAERMLTEVAYKIGRAPKYGA